MILKLNIEAYSGRTETGIILINSLAIINIDDNDTGCRIYYNVRVNHDRTATDYIDVTESKLYVEGQMENGLSNKVVELSIHKNLKASGALIVKKFNVDDFSFCRVSGVEVEAYINEGAAKRVRYLVDGSISDLYDSISNSKSATISSEGTKDIIVGDTDIHSTMYVDYTAIISTTQQDGTIYVVNKGASTYYEFIDLQGDSFATLDASIDVTSTIITLTVTHTEGSDMTFNYSTRRKLL